MHPVFHWKKASSLYTFLPINHRPSSVPREQFLLTWHFDMTSAGKHIMCSASQEGKKPFLVLLAPLAKNPSLIFGVTKTWSGNGFQASLSIRMPSPWAVTHRCFPEPWILQATLPRLGQPQQRRRALLCSPLFAQRVRSGRQGYPHGYLGPRQPDSARQKVPIGLQGA